MNLLLGLIMIDSSPDINFMTYFAASFILILPTFVIRCKAFSRSMEPAGTSLFVLYLALYRIISTNDSFWPLPSSSKFLCSSLFSLKSSSKYKSVPQNITKSAAKEESFRGLASEWGYM